MLYKITKTDRKLKGCIELPASKSISNRLLIIRAICPDHFEIHNLSESSDTTTLTHLLLSETRVKDVADAGTPYRLLCAYLSIIEGDWLLTGSARMKNRPIGPLVDALRILGADITYTEKEGFPPLQIKGKKLQGGTISIDGSLSSQFISALMLIAPGLTGGLTLIRKGRQTSLPYVMMTMSLMRQYGVPVKMTDEAIHIPDSMYQPVACTVEADWSAASYYYALAALCQHVDLELKGLRWDSIQGDKVIMKWMESFGLKTTFHQGGVHLAGAGDLAHTFSYDFSHQPDLAQTVISVCAALGIEGKFSGLENLKIKETDRIMAMKLELAKVGRHLFERNGSWHLMMISSFKKRGPVIFETYQDHRMAMSLSCFAMCFDEIFIADPMVVRKSNPDFWDHLAALDFTLEQISSD